MVDKEKWQYDATLTIRLGRATKDKLWQEAEAKGVPFSEHVRDVLVRGKLPEELLARLSPECRVMVKKLARQWDKDATEVLWDLIPRAILNLFNRVCFGL